MNNQPNDKEPDQLANLVSEYHKSIREEFDAISSGDNEALARKVKDKFAAKLLDFADTVIELSQHGESDSVRLSSAKFGLNFVLGGKVDEASDDPLNKLIKHLMKEEPDSKEAHDPVTE